MGSTRGGASASDDEWDQQNDDAGCEWWRRQRRGIGAKRIGTGFYERVTDGCERRRPPQRNSKGRVVGYVEDDVFPVRDGKRRERGRGWDDAGQHARVDAKSFRGEQSEFSEFGTAVHAKYGEYDDNRIHTTECGR